MDYIKGIDYILNNESRLLSVTEVDILKQMRVELSLEPNQSPSLEQLRSIFKNFDERFNTEAVFNKVMNSIAHGSGLFDIIDTLLIMQKKQSDLMAYYVTKYGVPNKVKSEEE